MINFAKDTRNFFFEWILTQFLITIQVISPITENFTCLTMISGCNIIYVTKLLILII